MSWRIGIVSLAALLLLGSACGRNALPTDPSAPSSLDEVVRETSSLGARGRHGAAQVFGQTRSGALFALFRPERWNGDLVLYAHGYVAPQNPVALPSSENVEPVREMLLARGFAVAYSSYSENGLPVEDAIRSTAQLELLYAVRLGRPRRVFLTAHSFGGLVATALAERRPQHYAGVLATSGLVGGLQPQIDYVSDIRVLFDVFYPGALPGDLLHLPPGLTQEEIIQSALAAIQSNPTGVGVIAAILGIPYRSGEELVGAIIQGLVFQAIELEDLLSRTGGKSFFDNSTRVYSGPLPPDLLAFVNASVARHTSAPEVKRFFTRWYQPTGRLRIPMITMHSEFDPAVPAFHERLYASLVAAHGDATLLEQRFTGEPAHVTYPASVIVAAFEDLVRRAAPACEDDDDEGAEVGVAVNY